MFSGSLHLTVTLACGLLSRVWFVSDSGDIVAVVTIFRPVLFTAGVSLAGPAGIGGRSP